MEKKQCRKCHNEKNINQFFKTNDLESFPDERYHTCSKCVKEDIDPSNLVKVHSFLAEINRPFIKDFWEKSQKSNTHPLSDYLRKLSTNQIYRELHYEDSDMQVDGELLEKKTNEIPHVFDKTNKMVALTNDVRQKWSLKNSEYTDSQILQLEVFYRNMAYDYEIDTYAKSSMLDELAILSLEKQRLLNAGDHTGYASVSRAYTSTMKDAGFRPVDVDKQQSTVGVDSLGEMIAHIERDSGFIAPDRFNYKPDDIDMMLAYYKSWAQGFTNQEINVEDVKRGDWRKDITEEEVIKDIYSSHDEKEGDNDIIE